MVAKCGESMLSHNTGQNSFDIIYQQADAMDLLEKIQRDQGRGFGSFHPIPSRTRKCASSPATNSQGQHRPHSDSYTLNQSKIDANDTTTSPSAL